MKKVVLTIIAVFAPCIFLSACLGKPEISKLKSYAAYVKEAVWVQTETVISRGGYTLNARKVDYLIGEDGVTVTEEVTTLTESLEEGNSYVTTVENYTVEREELFVLFAMNIDDKIDKRYFENGEYKYGGGVLTYAVKPALAEDFLNGSAQADGLTVKVVFESTFVTSFIMDYLLPSGNSVKTKFSYEYKTA